VPIAASIFLDVFNVFLFVLQLFGGARVDGHRHGDLQHLPLNTDPLGGVERRGDVVLGDLCTPTCINWLRTAP
jgi:hypothetical protein